MKFAANLGRLWVEVPYLDRFEAAALAGFDGVAVPFPYEMAAKETKRAMLRSGLPVVQISAPPPNYTGGARGFAAVPELTGRFQYDLRRALRYCQELRVPVLQIMAGEASGDTARQTLLDNLRFASGQLPSGMVLTLEPQAQKGAFLNDFDVAASVIEELDLPNIGLQFHSKHAHLIHGSAVSTFEKYGHITRHIQLADAPLGRALGSGEIEFLDLMAAIKAVGYDDWIVADFECIGPTEDCIGSFLSLVG
ncbi:MAG: TIM barrel protein [Roseobacter sp.]